MAQKTVQDHIRDAVARHTDSGQGIPVELALAVAEQESGFNPTLINPKKVKTAAGEEQAVGTFQFLPSTARTFNIDPMDPAQNIDGGVRYLRQLMDKHGGNIDNVLKEYGGVVHDTTYVPAVRERLNRYLRLSGAARKATPVPFTALMPGAVPLSTPTTRPEQPYYASPAEAERRIGDPLVKQITGVPIGESLDPRTGEGRTNLAATAGSIGGALLTKGLPVGALSTKVLQFFGSALGAATLAAGERAVEETLGTQPSTPSSVMATGLYQGSLDMGGAMFMWPIQRILRVGQAPGVAAAAVEKLQTEKAATRASGRSMVSKVRERLQQVVRAQRITAAEGTQAARMAARTATRATRQQGLEQLAQIELDNTARMAVARRAYDNLLAQPPSLLGTGEIVRQAGEGPVVRAQNLAGQRVKTAASTGPLIDWTPVTAALNDMAAEARPAVIYGQASGEPAGIGFLRNLASIHAASTAAATAAETNGAKAGLLPANADPSRLSRLIAEQLNIPLEQLPVHLPALLGRIQSLMGKKTTFADAHAIKMLLDETVDWDSPARNHIQRLTKGIRIALRDAMRGPDAVPLNPEYEQATAAYAAIAPLYTEGVGAKILEDASSIDGAARVADMLRKHDPAEARALKWLLVDQATAGGNPALGRQAWDAVRSVYAYEHLLSDGVAKLGERVQDLMTTRPEFTRIVFGDDTGMQILRNFGAISDAVQQATTEGATRVAQQKAATTAATTATREAGEQHVFRTKQAGARATEAAIQARTRGVEAATQAAEDANAAVAGKIKRFEKSTLQPFTRRTVEGEILDATSATLLGPQYYAGRQAILRLFKAPNAGDLAEWAAYSNYNTGRVVRALTSPMAPAALANLVREMLAIRAAGRDTNRQQATPTTAAPAAAR